MAEHEAMKARARLEEEQAAREEQAKGGPDAQHSDSSTGKAAAKARPISIASYAAKAGLANYWRDPNMPSPSGKPMWQVTLDDPVLIPGSGLVLDPPQDAQQQQQQVQGAAGASEEKPATTVCIPHPTYRQLLQWWVLVSIRGLMQCRVAVIRISALFSWFRFAHCKCAAACCS